MGKKGLNTSGKAGAPVTSKDSSTLQESKEAILTGIFSNDVPTLCKLNNIPPIAVVIRTNPLTQQFSFVIDSDESEQEVSAIYMRGWLLSSAVGTVLIDALATCKTLTAVNLWNVGLCSSTFDIVIRLLDEHNIRELSLDGNHLSLALPLVSIVKSKSLSRLSLKNCGLDHHHIEALAPFLSTNETLLHLNLSCNFVGNDGCTALASCLRHNRTLLSLSLMDNSIGDSGVISLAQVLSRFPLDHSEIVERRKLLSKKAEDRTSPAPELHTDRTRDPSSHGKSPSLNKSVNKGDKVTPSSKKKGDQKVSEKVKKEDKTKKVVDTKKGKGSKDGKSAKKGADLVLESPHPEPMQSVNPLIDDELPVEKEGYQLFLPGNTSLVFLSLAYNHIGTAGIHALLDALQVQEKYLNRSHGPGLLRLTLHHNLPKLKQDVPERDIQEISAILDKRNTSSTAGEGELNTDSQ